MDCSGSVSRYMEAMQDETKAPSLASNTEDKLLSAWARRGDRAALGELFGLCRPQAYALALRIAGRALAYAAHVLAASGALGILRARREIAALRWCPDGAGLALVRERIADRRRLHTKPCAHRLWTRRGALPR